MPVYSFYCEKCSKEFEIITVRAEWKDIRCRTCGSKVKKLMDAPGMIDIKGYNAGNGYSKGVEK